MESMTRPPIWWVGPLNEPPVSQAESTLSLSLSEDRAHTIIENAKQTTTRQINFENNWNIS